MLGKAEMLNRYFCSVVRTKQEVASIPYAGTGIEILPAIIKEDVKQHLLKLNIFKPTGSETCTQES